MNLTLGSDPELMIRNKRTGKIVSSIPILKRDKNNPIVLSNGAKLYSDNVLAEFSHPPIRSSGEAIESFRKTLYLIQEQLGNDHCLEPRASHVYGLEELGKREKNELGEETNPAWATGCNPNNDAYLERENPKVDFRDGLRTGSFHIHVGHDKLKTMWDQARAAKLLDIYVGCASVVFDKDPTALMRRNYYGRAGEFRPTPYGVEWRVLGNYPLRTPELTKLVFDLVTYACTHIENGTIEDVLSIKEIQMMAQGAINNCLPTLAAEVLCNAMLPVRLLARVGETYEVPEMNKAWGLS